MEKDWRVYNHALISTKMPHEEHDINNLNEFKKWKDKSTLFIRWTSDFDCGFETNWWYCLKDDEFDVTVLKSKRRYVINKGIKNFDIKQLENVNENIDEMYEVYVDSLTEYPEKYRSNESKEEFLKSYIECKDNIFFGVWSKDSNEFAGYIVCTKISNEKESIINLQAVKVKNKFVKQEINAAIGYFICVKFLNEEKVKYIYDGERNIRHITNYQEYLIKYFGFRKAYCKLNIKYKPMFKIIINILYPFKNILKNTNNKLLYNIYCVLKQEEIRRSFL